MPASVVTRTWRLPLREVQESPPPSLEGYTDHITEMKVVNLVKAGLAGVFYNCHLMLSNWRQLILIFITSCFVLILVSGNALAQVSKPSPLAPQVLAVNALVAKFDHPDGPGLSVA